ncbi:MAG TPA: NUDIX domain-containing protein [Pseudonocardia sp.]|nr:NUDIX domain-containing protein [Pseudonocardia sp.]
MPVLRSTVLVDAPQRTVAGLLRDADTAAEALGRSGHSMTAPARLLRVDDEVGFLVRVLPGLRFAVHTRITRTDQAGFASELVTGRLRALTHTTTVSAAGSATRVVDEITWSSPWGPLGRCADLVLVGGLVRRLLAARTAVLLQRAAALAGHPVVVATAIVRDGRVLAAQRTRPPALAGRWELPGGRVEAGEPEPDAVVRECREELGAKVRVTGRLGTDLPMPAGLLRVYTAEIVDGSAEPRALEHAEVRWLAAAEVADVDWVETDRAVLHDLVDLLRVAPAGA